MKQHQLYTYTQKHEEDCLVQWSKNERLDSKEKDQVNQCNQPTSHSAKSFDYRDKPIGMSSVPPGQSFILINSVQSLQRVLQRSRSYTCHQGERSHCRALLTLGFPSFIKFSQIRFTHIIQYINNNNNKLQHL